MNIIEHIPFKACIYTVSVELDVQKVLHEIRNKIEMNKGHSLETSSFTDCYLDLLAMDVIPIVNQIYKLHDVDSDGVVLQKYWINHGESKHYMEPHNHPRAYFSAVLYLSVPPNSGKLKFLRPDGFTTHIPIQQKENVSERSYDIYEFEPKVGQLIIFPSNLYHFVTGDIKDRISLAFDFR
jgi:uncharacterized protein (TIGR02466 family)